MKDKSYILLKIIKKNTIPLLLLLVAMVLFFTIILDKPIAYAQEQIAGVKCDVCVVEGDSVEVIQTNSTTVSNFEQALIEFGDVNVELNSRSKLEYICSVEKFCDDDCELTLKLDKTNLVNFKIEYYVDDIIFEGEELNYNITGSDLVKVKVVLSIVDVSKDAVLNGSISLTLCSLGGVNG